MAINVRTKLDVCCFNYFIICLRKIVVVNEYIVVSEQLPSGMEHVTRPEFEKIELYSLLKCMHNAQCTWIPLRIQMRLYNCNK